MTCKEHYASQLLMQYLGAPTRKKCFFPPPRSFMLSKYAARVSHGEGRLRSGSLVKAILQNAVSGICKATASLRGWSLVPGPWLEKWPQAQG